MAWLASVYNDEENKLLCVCRCPTGVGLFSLIHYLLSQNRKHANKRCTAGTTDSWYRLQYVWFACILAVL